MVQPDVVELDPLALDGEQPRELALEADRDVAEPHRSVPLIQERLRHHAGRIREVDEPGARGATARGELGELEHHRHGAEPFREPSGTGRLLTDAPEPERDGLVDEPGLIATDAQLHDHEVGALERFVTVGGEREPAAPSHLREHPRGETPHDLEAARGDIEQGEFVYRQPLAAPGEPLDEFGGVGAPSADDRHLHTHGPGIVHSRHEIVRKLS